MKNLSSNAKLLWKLTFKESRWKLFPKVPDSLLNKRQYRRPFLRYDNNNNNKALVLAKESSKFSLIDYKKMYLIWNMQKHNDRIRKEQSTKNNIQCKRTHDYRFHIPSEQNIKQSSYLNPPSMCGILVFIIWSATTTKRPAERLTYSITFKF